MGVLHTYSKTHSAVFILVHCQIPLKAFLFHIVFESIFMYSQLKYNCINAEKTIVRSLLITFKVINILWFLRGLSLVFNKLCFSNSMFHSVSNQFTFSDRLRKWPKFTPPNFLEVGRTSVRFETDVFAKILLRIFFSILFLSLHKGSARPLSKVYLQL